MPAGVAGGHRSSPSPHDITRALASAAVAQQHPREALQVRRGAEQAGMPGHAAHAPRGRIVHHAAQRRRLGPLARPGVLVGASLRRRDARQQRRRRVEPGVASCRADRTRVRFRYASSGCPVIARHDVAEQEEVDVAVDEASRRVRRSALHRSRVRSPRRTRSTDAGPRRAAGPTRASIR